VPPVSQARLTLPDRYRVVRHLANGGMASVWEAHDELLGRSVAVKVLASHLSEDDRARRRFQREARAAAGLSSHPHVVTIYDVGEHAGRTFMVMELMGGGSVADRLRAGERIPHRTGLRWLHEAAGALDAAHDAGVVHRDVKPANLLLDERDRLAIADFGIARVAFDDQLTATGQVLGTAAYIAPEQAVGDPATAASDRYAFAVVAFELLTGRRPFEAEHFAAQARAHVEDEPPLASERDPGIPPAVDQVLDRGMAKAPADRWGSATEMVSALERAAASASEPTEPTRPVAAAAAAGAGRRGPAALAAASSGAGRHTPGSFAPAASGRRGPAALVVAAVAGVVGLAVLGFVLLSGGDGGGGGGGEPTQTASDPPQKERDQEKQRDSEATPTATATPEATTTPEPTTTASPEPTPTAPPAASGLDAASEFQLDGYNARRAGNYEQSLQLSQQALEACGNQRPLDPCGYATFEVGLALNRLGRPEEAIPYLQQRLEYGNSSEAQAELEDAQAKLEGDGNRGKGGGNGNRGNDDDD
jgi:predicted Ser/Thr protein kinase